MLNTAEMYGRKLIPSLSRKRVYPIEVHILMFQRSRPLHSETKSSAKNAENKLRVTEICVDSIMNCNCCGNKTTSYNRRNAPDEVAPQFAAKVATHTGKHYDGRK